MPSKSNKIIQEYFKISEYNPKEVIKFKKVDEPWGGFSNFSREFPIEINGTKFDCSERLFQILRYTDYPDFQIEFMKAKSAFWAKKLKYKHKEKIRKDWDNIALDVMKFVLNEKKSQNPEFTELLNKTIGKYIVEDATGLNGASAMLWGTKFNEINDLYCGMNHMGKLLMDLRDFGRLEYINFPNDLKLFGNLLIKSAGIPVV